MLSFFQIKFVETEGEKTVKMGDELMDFFKVRKEFPKVSLEV